MLNFWISFEAKLLMHLWFRYEPEKRKITIFAAKILIPYIISVEGRRGAKNKFNPQIDILQVFEMSTGVLVGLRHATVFYEQWLKCKSNFFWLNYGFFCEIKDSNCVNKQRWKQRYWSMNKLTHILKSIDFFGLFINRLISSWNKIDETLINLTY